MILCIEEAHRMNWIHRDIKPDNFLITASGHLKISDFGLAFDGHWTHNQTYYNEQRYGLLQDLDLDIRGDEQDIEEERERQAACRMIGLINSNITSRQRQAMKQDAANGPILDWLNRTQKRQFAKSIVGTSQYMAPEVIRGENYDGRCDWWSVGIILYEVCHTNLPNKAELTLIVSLRLHTVLPRKSPAHESTYSCKSDLLDFSVRVDDCQDHRRHLRFPNDPRFARPNIDRVPLMPVSRNAIDLMMRLLEDRQDRLSCKRYRENDWVLRDKAIGARRYRSFKATGHIVFPNDAEDIKAHPFFRDIQWSTLHLTRPPFVPRVHGGQPITKYFDDEAEIMSASDHLDSSSYEVTQEQMNGATVVEGAKPLGKEESIPTVVPAVRQKNGSSPAYGQICQGFQKIKRRKKEKKRPRDKLLRDPEVGRLVLETRKKGAFFAYTYRRPRFSLPELDVSVDEAGMRGTRIGGVAVSA